MLPFSRTPLRSPSQPSSRAHPTRSPSARRAPRLPRTRAYIIIIIRRARTTTTVITRSQRPTHTTPTRTLNRPFPLWCKWTRAPLRCVFSRWLPAAVVAIVAIVFVVVVVVAVFTITLVDSGSVDSLNPYGSFLPPRRRRSAPCDTAVPFPRPERRRNQIDRPTLPLLFTYHYFRHPAGHGRARFTSTLPSPASTLLGRRQTLRLVYAHSEYFTRTLSTR